MNRDRSTRPFSLATKVMLWLAAHPEDELCTEAVALKFNVPKKDVTIRLSCVAKTGFLDMRKESLAKGGIQCVYAAGPLLRDAINR